jgi:subtilisin family serine protease
MKQREKGNRFKYGYIVVSIICLFGVTLAASGDWGPQPPYHPRQILVKLSRDTSIHTLQKENGLPGLKVKQDYRGLGQMTGSRYLLLELGEVEGLDIRRIKERLEEFPGVHAASLNVKRRLMTIPDDPLFQKQWGLHNRGQQAYLHRGQEDIDIDAPEAWDRAIQKGEPVVAVIDTGMDLGHPDLLENTWTNINEIPGNNIDDDGNGYIDDINGYDFCGDSGGVNDPDPMDHVNHGTHVSGIIAASVDNGIGVAGIGLNTKIMVLKIFHPTSETSALADELEAFEYILAMKKRRNVNIVAVNCSFGSTEYSSLEKDVVSQCNDAGIAVVCAAGNGDDDSNGYNIDDTPLYPASLDLPNVIGVAAIDNRGQLADFSNFGKQSVDLAAPGVGIMSTFQRGNGSEAKIVFNNSQIQAFSLDFGGKTNGVSGHFYDCGKGISIGDFPPGVSGNIALIERGEVYFSQKVTNAQLAGAIAAVVYNNEAGGFSGTLQEDKGWIPALSISREEGLHIRLSGNPAPATVINRSADYDYKSGTSMATPHVSGALALVSRQFPGDDMNRLIARVLLAGKPLSTLQTQTRYGTILKIPNSDIHEPNAAGASLHINESFFSSEYIVSISFKANLLNQGHDIQSYRIYRAGGSDIELIAEIPKQHQPGQETYSVMVRRVQRGTGTLYMAVAVASDGTVGRPAFMVAD